MSPRNTPPPGNSWSGESVNQVFGIEKYISLVGLMIFAFGVGFLLPVLLVFLQLVGVVTPRTLLGAWRYAIVGIFCLGLGGMRSLGLFAARVDPPEVENANLAAATALKQVVDVPVMFVGQNMDPLGAEAILQNEQADIIAMGRALLADPELPEVLSRPAGPAQKGRVSRLTSRGARPSGRSGPPGAAGRGTV